MERMLPGFKHSIVDDTVGTGSLGWPSERHALWRFFLGFARDAWIIRILLAERLDLYIADLHVISL